MEEQTYLIPVRESWQPEILHGYLPVPQHVIQNLMEKKEGLIINYPVENAPPGSQLSFLLTHIYPDGSTDTEISLCSYDYPAEIVARIQGYEGDYLIAGQTTVH